MSETDGLIAFLGARYDEAEALAEAVFSAAELFSKAPQRSPSLGHQVFDGSGIVVTHDRSVVLPSDVAAYIAANDPAHRLRDIALKRDIVADCMRAISTQRTFDPHGAVSGTPYSSPHANLAFRVLRSLASEYDTHPDCREEQKP